MADYGELNVGQLVRQRYGRGSMLVGFTTYTGSVTAASEWDGPAERMRVRPALADSYEELFHSEGPTNFLMSLKGRPAREPLRQTRLERAIGVIYVPQTERQSHYFNARLSEQFDVVIHFDKTRALEPLEREALWESSEPPETFPTGV
jgi:erythromycin esterase-like protein